MGIDERGMGIDPRSVAGPTPASPAAGAPAGQGMPQVQGADFARILDELLASAGSLGARAAVPASDPKQIQEAVAEAKQSLDAAVALGETLLEAYRRATIAEPPASDAPKGPKP